MMYQYAWKHKLLPLPLTTVDGEEVRVHYAGRHNTDSGPDFIGARLTIGSQPWGGNVEVHVRASDWMRHGHHTDPAYSNVILHLVAINDARVCDCEGRQLPQTVAAVPRAFASLYAMLAKKIGDVRCAGSLHEISSLARIDWLNTLAVERLQQKAGRVLHAVEALNGDWQHACFATLARALGFGINAEPFEMLARSIPMRVLAHHADNIIQLEALLFGQAGLLDTGLLIFDERYQMLCREYLFLARKYSLRPMKKAIWKYMRTRPQNFPHRRIALLAAVAESQSTLLSRLIEKSADIDEIKKMLSWHTSDYWLNHFDFDKESGRMSKQLSAASKDLLVVNFVAPMLYAYASYRGDFELADRAVALQTLLPAEKNSIIAKWNVAGIGADSALEAQALIQLRREYCDHDRCLECRFGNALLRARCKSF